MVPKSFRSTFKENFPALFQIPFLGPFKWWRQKVPRELKPNCLLTRYPIYFLEEPKSILEYCDPWNGIPRFLKDHGYEVRVISRIKDLNFSKGHIIACGNLAPEIIEVLNQSREEKIFSSVTLVDPIFNFESQSELLNNFSPPSRLVFGIMQSRESNDPVSRASQRVAKSWGPSFCIYEGLDWQLRGRGPRPCDFPSAHEFFLQHCIFLAECDLTTAE